jgi:hypothetical protein
MMEDNGSSDSSYDLYAPRRDQVALDSLSRLTGKVAEDGLNIH